MAYFKSPLPEPFVENPFHTVIALEFDRLLAVSEKLSENDICKEYIPISSTAYRHHKEQKALVCFREPSLEQNTPLIFHSPGALYVMCFSLYAAGYYCELSPFSCTKNLISDQKFEKMLTALDVIFGKDRFFLRSHVARNIRNGALDPNSLPSVYLKKLMPKLQVCCGVQNYFCVASSSHSWTADYVMEHCRKFIHCEDIKGQSHYKDILEGILCAAKISFNKPSFLFEYLPHFDKQAYKIFPAPSSLPEFRVVNLALSPSCSAQVPFNFSVYSSCVKFFWGSLQKNSFDFFFPVFDERPFFLQKDSIICVYNKSKYFILHVPLNVYGTSIIAEGELSNPHQKEASVSIVETHPGSYAVTLFLLLDTPVIKTIEIENGVHVFTSAVEIRVPQPDNVVFIDRNRLLVCCPAALYLVVGKEPPTLTKFSIPFSIIFLNSDYIHYYEENSFLFVTITDKVKKIVHLIRLPLNNSLLVAVSAYFFAEVYPEYNAFTFDDRKRLTVNFKSTVSLMPTPHPSMYFRDTFFSPPESISPNVLSPTSSPRTPCMKIHPGSLAVKLSDIERDFEMFEPVPALLRYSRNTLTTVWLDNELKFKDKKIYDAEQAITSINRLDEPVINIVYYIELLQVFLSGVSKKNFISESAWEKNSLSHSIYIKKIIQGNEASHSQQFHSDYFVISTLHFKDDLNNSSKTDLNLEVDFTRGKIMLTAIFLDEGNHQDMRANCSLIKVFPYFPELSEKLLKAPSIPLSEIHEIIMETKEMYNIFYTGLPPKSTWKDIIGSSVERYEIIIVDEQSNCTCTFLKTDENFTYPLYHLGSVGIESTLLFFLILLCEKMLKALKWKPSNSQEEFKKKLYLTFKKISANQGRFEIKMVHPITNPDHPILKSYEIKGGYSGQLESVVLTWDSIGERDSSVNKDETFLLTEKIVPLLLYKIYLPPSEDSTVLVDDFFYYHFQKMLQRGLTYLSYQTFYKDNIERPSLVSLYLNMQAIIDERIETTHEQRASCEYVKMIVSRMEDALKGVNFSPDEKLTFIAYLIGILNQNSLFGFVNLQGVYTALNMSDEFPSVYRFHCGGIFITTLKDAPEDILLEIKMRFFLEERLSDADDYTRCLDQDFTLHFTACLTKKLELFVAIKTLVFNISPQGQQFKVRLKECISTLGEGSTASYTLKQMEPLLEHVKKAIQTQTLTAESLKNM